MICRAHMICRAQTFEAWLKANLGGRDGYMKDLAEYGAQGGFPGLTYYKDTGHLYRRYTDDLWAILREEAEAQGQTVLEFLAACNGTPDDATGFENFVVWICAETVARRLTDD